MNYWLISDTHFSHTKLEEWGHRSGDWEKQLWEGKEITEQFRKKGGRPKNSLEENRKTV